MKWTEPGSFVAKKSSILSAGGKLTAYEETMKNPGIYFKLNSDENKPPVVLGNILVNQRTT